MELEAATSAAAPAALLGNGASPGSCCLQASRPNTALTLASRPPPHPGPCSPKRFFLPLQVLLGPILPLASSLFGWIADSTARNHNKAHGMPPRAGSAAGEGEAGAAAK